MPLTNLPSWLSYLETLHPQAIDLGLERIHQVAQTLKLIPFNCPVITVAGTNGKGSCVGLLETTLLAAGYHVGAYTSPHLLCYNERTRINGVMVTDAVLCEAFTKIEQARGNISLTYFEFGTLAALMLFKAAQLDVVILEVGLGGRCDAVNIVDPDVAIISTVAIDHVEWLGTDRETIGREKAGIMRATKPVVCGDFAVPNSVRHYAEQISAPLFCQGQDFGYSQQTSSWTWWSKASQLADLPLPKIALQNAATVLQAIELLGPKLKVSRSAINQGLAQVFIPGRFQQIASPVAQIFDVAHNPSAAALLATQLQSLPVMGKTIAVVAMLNDKDSLGTIAALFVQVAIWHVAGLAGARGGSSQLLAEAVRKLGATMVHEHTDVAAAYRAAVAQAGPEDRVVIFGSFHTVAEAMQVRL